MRDDADPYLVLGVSPTATQAEITHAYRDRLRAHHPDTRHTPPSKTADDDLRQILAAYALLRDRARRAEYDRANISRPAHRAPADRVQIPITYRTTNTTPTDDSPGPPLRAGPVRRHR